MNIQVSTVLYTKNESSEETFSQKLINFTKAVDLSFNATPPPQITIVIIIIRMGYRGDSVMFRLFLRRSSIQDVWSGVGTPKPVVEEGPCTFASSSSSSPLNGR